MRKILEAYVQNNQVPENLKGKVMQSARLFILAKDLGELFTVGISESGKDLTQGIEDIDKSNLSKQKNKNNE